MSAAAAALTTGGIIGLILSVAAFIAVYRLGRRDGLEEKAWLEELPPVPLAEANLTALDIRDTTDRLILEARLELPE